jgi:hypothetical protein
VIVEHVIGYSSTTGEPSLMMNSPLSEQDDSVFRERKLKRGETFISKGAQETLRKLSLKSKKNIVLNDMTLVGNPRLLARIQALLDRVQKPLNDDECWIFEDPPTHQQRKRRIAVSVRLDKLNTWDPQFGLLKLLLQGRITKKQKDGIIHKNWHLSHLCGDWRCLNSQHFTIEECRVNQARKRCINTGYCCGHGDNPSCFFETRW